ncbi:MAG TPA: glutamine amidotransferase [Actinomycetes bacterium]|jgi:CobQ-like glutamine amidotransferase family enzyme|nr:glutamine amidotransferase [Actinomycetes bacterium]
MAEPIRVGIVYPQLLGTYGDRGNAEVLAWRLRRRGHDAVVVDVPAPEPVPAGLDAYVLGGGEDTNQAAAVKLLLGPQGRGLRAALAAGVPALAVCGSLQLLGEVYLDGTGQKVPGMHVLDLETTASGPRCVGEVVARMPDGVLLTGFENHGGRTRLGSGAEPLATVLHGNGNNGADGTEGVRRGNLIATYLHGPVLARNPALADALARAILERRGSPGPLAPIEPDPGAVLHDARLRAVGFGPRRGRPGRGPGRSAEVPTSGSSRRRRRSPGRWGSRW